MAVDDDGVGVAVPHHVNQRNLVEVEDWVAKPTKNGSFTDGEDGTTGVVDVDHLLVKNCDVVGNGKLPVLRREC